MAAVALETPFADRCARRAVFIASQPLPKRRAAKPTAPVKATPVTPFVHDAVEASAKTAGMGGYFPWAGAKAWSRSVLEKHLPSGCKRVIIPCGGACSDANGYPPASE